MEKIKTLSELKDLVCGEYHEYNAEPFDMDAEGFVERDDLVAYGDDACWDLLEDNEDETVPKDGYVLFYAEGKTYIADRGLIWYQVWEDDRLDTGWGRSYGNGLSSCGAPKAYTVHDGEEIYLR